MGKPLSNIECVKCGVVVRVSDYIPSTDDDAELYSDKEYNWAYYDCCCGYTNILRQPDYSYAVPSHRDSWYFHDMKKFKSVEDAFADRHYIPPKQPEDGDERVRSKFLWWWTRIGYRIHWPFHWVTVKEQFSHGDWHIIGLYDYNVEEETKKLLKDREAKEAEYLKAADEARKESVNLDIPPIPGDEEDEDIDQIMNRRLRE
jgi:hypothetical protein